MNGEYLTVLMASFNSSPSEVKFWAMCKVPAKSTTAIIRLGDAVPSTNFPAACRAWICSAGLMVESSKNRTI